MKKKFSMHPSIGYSFFIFFFLTLSLVSFATLSYVTAQSNYRLSKKNADRMQAYYDTCTEAELWISKIDDLLANAYSQSSNESDYFSNAERLFEYAYIDFQNNAGSIQLSNTFSISETQELVVTLVPSYPITKTDALYRIQTWSLVTVHSYVAHSNKSSPF